MAAKVLRETETEVVIELTVPKSRDFFRCEENIQEALNQAGRLATGTCLEDFDTDGSPIILDGEKYTAKRSKVGKDYECRYGTVHVDRYAYQNSSGGEVYFPLEHNARILGGTTPSFAKIASFGYSHDNSAVVQSMLRQTLESSVNLF